VLAPLIVAKHEKATSNVGFRRQYGYERYNPRLIGIQKLLKTFESIPIPSGTEIIITSELDLHKPYPRAGVCRRVVGFLRVIIRFRRIDKWVRRRRAVHGYDLGTIELWSKVHVRSEVA
jgi:hypothetical protein